MGRRVLAACLAVVAVAAGAPAGAAAEPSPPAPASSDAASGAASDPSAGLAAGRERAAALRRRLDALQVRIDDAVDRFREATEALDAAAAREVAGAASADALARAADEARARSGRAARTLYMSGGSAAVYATALQGGSIADVLDGLASAHQVVAGARRAQAGAETAARRAAAAQGGRRTGSDAQVRLIAQARSAAAEAQALQVTAQAELDAADATVARMVAEERARAAAAERARAAAAEARRIAAARAAAAAVGTGGVGTGGVPSSPVPSTYRGSATALSAAELVDVLRRAGFAGEGLRVAWAVAMRESGGRPGAVGRVNGNGTRDHGLFQLNDVHLGRVIDAALVYDADANAAAAFRLSRGGTDWGAWGLGTTGWAGSLLRSIPAVYARLRAAFLVWYGRFPLA